MDFENEVKEMIDCHSEGDYLDFKEEDYHKDNKQELVKDIIAFANSHSTRNKYIIIGAIEENNLCTGLKNIDKSQIKDEANFQQIVKTYIYENLVVNYKVLNICDNDILVIQIPSSNNDNRPFMVKKQIGNLRENDIYIRRGSSTDLATKKDLEYMFKSNTKSKLLIQSYLDGKIEDNLQLNEINKIIKQYKDAKLRQLIDNVKRINNLKGNKYFFAPDIFLSKDKIELEQDTVEFIKKALKVLNIKYDTSIFEFPNIKKKINLTGGIYGTGSTSLCGDSNEIERYWLIKELNDYILEYFTINDLYEKLPKIYSTNLLISNIGNYFDEDIELKLIINKKDFINAKIFIPDETSFKYLGNLYKDLREYLIDCPKVSNVDQYYNEFPIVQNSTPYVPDFMGFMQHSEPTYLEQLEENADNFKYDIENLFVNGLYEENDKIVLKIDFNKIMQNKSIFLESKILLANKNVEIAYEIRSKNTPNIIEANITTN